MGLDNRELYQMLKGRFRGNPEDRKGNVWIECPACKATRARQKKTSFCGSPPVWHCFKCGTSGTLYNLAELLRMDLDRPIVAPKPRRRKQKVQLHAWTKDPWLLIQAYKSHPGAQRLWNEYHPLMRRETLARHHLGVGRFPEYASRCRHLRLMYPGISPEGKVVAIRGRRIDCDCPGQKWVSAKDSKVTLAGWQSLAQGKVVFVMENPVDAFLWVQEFPYVAAVAPTAGSGTWRQWWTELIVSFNPPRVVIAYDNDLAGQVRDRERWEKEFFKKHPNARVAPKAGGPMVANTFARLRQPVELVPWHEMGVEYGFDAGDWLKQITEGR